MREDNFSEEQINEKEEVFAPEEIKAKEEITASESTLQNEGVTSETAFENRENRENLDNADGETEPGGSFKISGASAAGAAAVVAVAVMITVVSGSASIDKITPYGKSCDYELSTAIEYVLQDGEMADYDNFDTNLRLVVFAEDSEQTQVEILSTGNEELTCEIGEPKEKGESTSVKINFKGNVDGLYENTSYKAQIVGEVDGELKVLAEKSFKTKGLKSQFDSIEWECKCRVDGHFYYKLNYVDENNYYKDFEYEMIRKDTNEVFASGKIENPKKQQKIDVEEALGMDYILKIKYKSEWQKDIDNGTTNKTVEIDVKI